MAALGAGLGTVAPAFWPIAARAQTGSAPKLGVLMNSNPADTIQHSYWEALIEALKDAGWTGDRTSALRRDGPRATPN
jgi:hypothetical protein